MAQFSPAKADLVLYISAFKEDNTLGVESLKGTPDNILKSSTQSEVGHLFAFRAASVLLGMLSQS